MANKITEHRLIDSNKRALIKITGVLDTNLANNVLIDVSTLAQALNATGQIMTANTNPRSRYDVTVKRVVGNVNLNGYVKLQWQGAANTEFLVLGPNYTDFDLDKDGINAVIPNNETSSNGDILISTQGVVGVGAGNNSFSLLLDLRKSADSYDSGQTADPAAFNRGSFGI